MIKRKNVWLLGLLVSLAFAASIYAQGEYRGRWSVLAKRTWMGATTTIIFALGGQTGSGAPCECA